MPVHRTWLLADSRLWRGFQTHSRIGLRYSVHRSPEGSIHLRPDDRGNPIRLGPAFTHRPTHDRLSAHHEHAGMVVSISILFGIVVEIAKRLAQEQNVIRLAGQKRPAWS